MSIGSPRPLSSHFTSFAPMDEDAEAEHILSLFDHYWFRCQILHRTPPPPALSHAPSELHVEDAESRASQPHPTSHSPPLLAGHRRSRSAEGKDSFDPPRIPAPKLETILSGKEGVAPAAEGGVRQRGWRRSGGRSGGGSRSLSELEFDELKGLMDLGFTFSDTEADPRLVAIVPGLRRRAGDAAAEGVDDGDDSHEEGVARPYLSEVWEAREEEEMRERRRNWRVPAAGMGVDMKAYLRLWAHQVASTVR